MRDFAITSAKQGVTRLRNKGGASKDSFYTLKDCFVTSDRSIKPRPGTRRDTILPANTKGLMAFRGKLYVFSAEPVTITNPKYANLVLQHPEPGNTAQIRAIHFAQPFLGYPYVVAEFDDDATKFYHYWLQDTGDWQANTVYMFSEVVQPTTPNGYTYSATRLLPPDPTWTSGKPVQIGDKFEPTVPNGYYYEVVDAAGLNPITGETEPQWIAEEGATVYDDSDTNGGSTSAGDDDTPQPPPDVVDRYRNQGGNLPAREA